MQKLWMILVGALLMGCHEKTDSSLYIFTVGELQDLFQANGMGGMVGGAPHVRAIEGGLSIQKGANYSPHIVNRNHEVVRLDVDRKGWLCGVNNSFNFKVLYLPEEIYAGDQVISRRDDEVAPVCDSECRFIARNFGTLREKSNFPRPGRMFSLIRVDDFSEVLSGEGNIVHIYSVDKELNLVTVSADRDEFRILRYAQGEHCTLLETVTVPFPEGKKSYGRILFSDIDYKQGKIAVIEAYSKPPPWVHERIWVYDFKAEQYSKYKVADRHSSPIYAFFKKE